MARYIEAQVAPPNVPDQIDAIMLVVNSTANLLYRRRCVITGRCDSDMDIVSVTPNN